MALRSGGILALNLTLQEEPQFKNSKTTGNKNYPLPENTAVRGSSAFFIRRLSLFPTSVLVSPFVEMSVNDSEFKVC
ncbi:MAG: hypothetical protein IPG79_18310 [Saprospiraceae bacterium]|nr:hypothetical protein [Saprospiraceae bacterium]